jgi:septum formation protein
MLLEAAGLAIEVRPADLDETRDPRDAPADHAVSLAVRKAAVVQEPDAIVVAADTVVHLGDTLFDKTADHDLARTTLRALSGRWHTVTTGVCVRRGADRRVIAVHTEVRLRDLDDATIDRYLATGEADDKAGSYGIQGHGGALVAELRGSYTNVVGLPLEETLALLTLG